MLSSVDRALVPVHSFIEPMTNDSSQSGSSEAPSADAEERKTPFSDDELEHFRELLLQRRREAKEEVAQMREQVEQAKEQSGDNTAYGVHMADAGTDAMEREKLHLMIARQQKYIGYLERALERIENKTYGICRVTGEPISKERLEAVPHTEISIEAKRKEKS
jgi:RNA polymerase-binding protein DksA